jgi:hypothetical protein
MNTASWPPPTPDEVRLAEATGAKRVGPTQWSGGHCPNPEHIDAHPSFGFTRGRNFPIVANCLSCGDWSGIKSGISALGITSKVGKKRATVEEAPPPPLPIEDQAAPHTASARLLSRRDGKHFAYLTQDRGLTVDTLERHLIGVDKEGRITFPVRNGSGPWINIRRLDPWVRDKRYKWLNTTGHGAVTLYLSELLADNNLPVLLTEGELDCLLANQEADGRYVAVSGTGGASNVPRDLSPLAGREVFVVYDMDEAGTAGALKMVAALSAVDATARVLDLRDVGLSE